ncbi:MAG: hypothetical protein WAV78_36370, partial [Xanthobacteraceae bacterium]
TSWQNNALRFCDEDDEAFFEPDGIWLSRNGAVCLIFSTLQIHLHSQPTLGLTYDFWLLCESSYLLFVWVVNAIKFEHIASNPFCLLAEIPRFRCGVLSFSVMFVFQLHSCTIRQHWFRGARQ